jgi:prolyl 3-hydroxylase /prolyl 3,4-dihydroxylase
VEARRFRPGLDYTLATSDDKDARLDVILALTPDLNHRENIKGKGVEKDKNQRPKWSDGKWGGWEVSGLFKPENMKMRC